MFFVGKKTIYLSFYHEEQKIKPVGFLQMTGMREKVRVAIHIKNMREMQDAEYAVFVRFGGGNILQPGNVVLKGGNGCFEKEYGTSNDMIRIRGTEIPPESIEEIWVELTGKDKICGYFGTERDMSPGPVLHDEAEIQAKEAATQKVTPEKPAQQKMPVFREEPEAELICTDKWEQILKKYSNVHPFGDDRVFVSLNLQDLVILPEKYQKLVNNSFLLHGFYNYRHMILGKDYRLGSSMEKCFYLGVPGVYFEREKQVAVMFGFEGFECSGAVEVGKFGYYVREVSI